MSNNHEELLPNEISNIIGSDYFKDKIIRLYLKKELKDIDKREQPELAKINSLAVGDIIHIVGDYFNIRKKDRIVVRKSAARDARKIAMYLAVRYCKRTETLACIAAHFNVGINGISSNTRKCEEELLINKELSKQLLKIEELLHENTKTKV